LFDKQNYLSSFIQKPDQSDREESFLTHPVGLIQVADLGV